MDTTIIEKIRKLDALANNAGTEEEATLAASRVAELCAKHNLDIGSIALAQEETEATEAVHSESTSRAERHWHLLSNAVGKMFDCGYYASKGQAAVKRHGYVIGGKTESRVVFFGLKANVESALITYRYLLASVESMLEGWINAGNRTDRTARRAFRIGCAKRILVEANKIYQLKITGVQQNSELMAIVKLGNQLMLEHGKKLGIRSSNIRLGVCTSEGSAYQEGYSAGGRVDIHGARGSRMLN